MIIIFGFFFFCLEQLISTSKEKFVNIVSLMLYMLVLLTCLEPSNFKVQTHCSKNLQEKKNNFFFLKCDKPQIDCKEIRALHWCGLTWKHVLTSTTKGVFWTYVETTNSIYSLNSPLVDRDITISYCTNDFLERNNSVCPCSS